MSSRHKQIVWITPRIGLTTYCRNIKMPKQPDRMVSVYSAVRLVQSSSASLTHSTHEGSNCKASVVAITQNGSNGRTHCTLGFLSEGASLGPSVRKSRITFGSPALHPPSGVLPYGIGA